ncbi:MAG: regulatory protein RecX, partial [Lentisphaeria bacterium]|nr:regulatory protein RecX [Lentisphaeria bacterium]
MDQLPVSALEKAMKFLNRRAYSAAELTAKLLQAGFPESEAENAVNECKRRRFIDDALLAEDYTALLRARNTGSRMIRQKLVRRGLSSEIVDNQL